MDIDSQGYHRLTSYRRNQIPQHFLDWENQPSTLKIYPNIQPIYLPKITRFVEKNLSHVLKSQHRKDKPDIPNIHDLSKTLLLTYSATAKAKHGEGFHYYRSVASAGALYPTEIYVATHEIKGLANGLYHFSIVNHALIPLRDEDVTEFVADFIYETPKEHPSIVFLFTAIFFRSAWKYRERAYRYHLLDTGHLIENMALALKSQGFPFGISYNFEDREINRLLGLDRTKEVSLAVCNVAGPQNYIECSKRRDMTELGSSFKEASQMSSKEITYAAIHDIHQAGLIRSPGSPTTMPEINLVDMPDAQPTEIKEPDAWPELINYQEALFQRRSRRNFIPTPLPESHLAALLECLRSRALEETSDPEEIKKLPNIGLIVANAEGYKPGFYLMDDSKYYLQIVKEGRLTELMAHICLDQKWMANAAVHFLFLSNLSSLDQCWGPRGYRYIMMNAGRLGERLYLAATAMGLGCCGIGAFYDNEASQALGFKGESRLLYLIALGPVKSL